MFAQDTSEITLSTLDLTSFPTLSLEFKITGSGAESQSALTVDDLDVKENGQTIAATSLDQVYRGVLFSLVVNASRDLDLRDGSGKSRYEKLSDSLCAWAASRTFFEGDIWSFVTNDGVKVRASSTSANWTAGLTDYQPDFRALEPELTGLETAIQTAGEQVVSLGADKVLLFITPPPDADQIDALWALAEEARSAGIQVNVWMVGDELYLLNDQGGALMNLASVTGGQFFHYMGEESIPGPEEYLASLGYVYQITYESEIRSTGTYPFYIEISQADLHITSESQSFYIDVQPPKPILISPPAKIEVEIDTDKKSGVMALSLQSFAWHIMVEFPDGYEREIIASRLFVDGCVVDVNNTAPFDSFTWEISELTSPGEHTIQVEVEDSLGLSARTIITPVQVEWIEEDPTPGLSLQQIGLILAALTVAAAFMLLLISLVKRLIRVGAFNGIREYLSGRRKPVEVDPPPANTGEDPVLATLSPLNGALKSEEGNTLLITRPDVILGRDADRVDCVIDDEAVGEVHARIKILADGVWLEDLGSPGGTWVNYIEIIKEQVQIYPGDLIHFGSTGFQFTIEGSRASINVTVSKYESLL